MTFASFLLGLVLFITALIAVNLYRVVVGPTIFDRLLGVGLIGTNAVLIIVVIGFLFDRIDMFLDLALTYAVLNFIGVIMMGKYLEVRREETP